MIRQTIICFLISTAVSSFGEQSSIVFRDSTGTNRAVQFGWQGDQANGNFFVKQMADNKGMRLEDGNLSVDGTISANAVTAQVPGQNITGSIKGSLIDSIAWSKIRGQPTTTPTVVDSAGISSASVGSYHLRGNAVTSAKLATSSVNSYHIVDGTIDSVDVGALQIGTFHVRNAAITANKIALNAVTGTKIAENSISSSHIIDGTIDSADIAANEIGTLHIQAGAVTSAKIANNSIDSDKIINESICSADLLNQTVTNDDIATSANISGVKISPDFGTQNIAATGHLQLRNKSNPQASGYLRLNSDAVQTFEIRREDASCFEIQMNTSGHANNTLVIANGDMATTGRLEVIGGMLQAYDIVIAKGTIYADGGVYVKDGQTIRCSGVTTCSDSRYKRSIKTLDNSLEKILKLRGVSYEWDTLSFPGFRSQASTQIGFVAQETETVVPEVVQTDKNGYKSIDYSKITSVLVEAVKEQQKIIDTQKAELSSQKSMIESLSNRLAKLEALAQ